jgi:hypothetical protein
MPKYLKKQQQLINAATGPAGVLPGSAATAPILDHAAKSQSDRPQGSRKGKIHRALQK